MTALMNAFRSMALYRCAVALLGTVAVSACGGDGAPNGTGRAAQVDLADRRWR